MGETLTLLVFHVDRSYIERLYCLGLQIVAVQRCVLAAATLCQTSLEVLPLVVDIASEHTFGLLLGLLHLIKELSR